MLQKEIENILSKYNILGIVRGFDHEYMKNTGLWFEGLLNIVIFDRSKMSLIKTLLGDYILTGWLPLKDDSKSENDFGIVFNDRFDLETLRKMVLNVAIVMQVAVEPNDKGEFQIEAIIL